ncbi:MAG: TonB-dependent receptor [Pseudomonadota bacterium]
MMNFDGRNGQISSKFNFIERTAEKANLDRQRGNWSKILLTTSALALVSPSVGYAQDTTQETSLDLGTLVLDWENLGRPVDESPASNTLIDAEEVGRPDNKDVFDVIENVPNVVVETGPILPTVRGIDGSAGIFAATAFTAGSNLRFNVVVDGVARIPGAIGTGGQLVAPWDVGRVEVAVGPQTTQGGRSSLAGAVNVLTNDPVFENEGAARLSYAVRDGEPLFNVSGLYNLAVSDSLAFRVAFDGQFGDSFVDITDPTVASISDEIEDIENTTVRFKALFAPQSVPGLEIVFGYEREDRDQLNNNEVDIGTSFVLSDFASNNSEDEVETDIFSLRASYDTGTGLFFQGRFSYTESSLNILPSNIFFNLTQDFENYQGELLARYEGDGFLRRGVFGFAIEDQEEDGFNDTLGVFPLGFLFDVEGEFTNWSIFGEAEFAVTDSFFVFGGGRYEEQDIERTVFADFGFGPNSASVDTTDRNFSPRLGVRYEFGDATSVGYQFSEGFRPGSVDIDFFGSPPVAFEGETLQQHEIWLRHTDAGGLFSVNASAFFYTLDDAQVPFVGPNFLIGNVDEAEGYGFEFAGQLNLGRSTITASLGLTETEITELGTAPNVDPALLGTDLPNAAGVTFSLGYVYATRNGWEFGAELLHVGDRAPGVFTDPDLPSYTTLDLRAAYNTDFNGNPVRFDLFVNNVTDERIVAISDTFSGTETVGDPLTVGISARLDF